MYVPASDADVPQIVRLMNRAYRGSEAGSGWTTESAYIAGDRVTDHLLRADLQAQPAATLLKWVDAPGEPPKGCVWLEPLGDDTWYLGSLSIDPSLQNGGLGRVMLSAAEDWVRVRGARIVRMTVVNVRDTLIAWYKRRGYAETGETEPFPYEDNRFGTPLRDDLCFVVLAKRLA
jgi:ribosomal protein S18 acetylase RimI-like enzyme